MKKIYFVLLSFFCLNAGTTVFAQFSADKYYTIVNHNASNNNFYLQDNGVDALKMGAENGNSLWIFEPTGNADCYYLKNVKTGRYIQQCTTSGTTVNMGNDPVEYYVKADETGQYIGWYRFSSTNYCCPIKIGID